MKIPRSTILRKCWKFQLNDRGLVIKTPFFCLVISNMRPDWLADRLKTGTEFSWWPRWTKDGMGEGETLYRYDHAWRMTYISLFESYAGRL